MRYGAMFRAKKVYKFHLTVDNNMMSAHTGLSWNCQFFSLRVAAGQFI